MYIPACLRCVVRMFHVQKRDVQHSHFQYCSFHLCRMFGGLVFKYSNYMLVFWFWIFLVMIPVEFVFSRCTS